MQIIINIIVFLLILTTIIVVHEFGHFIAAKFFKVYCGAFSIGMGPKIFSKKGKETEFQIRALPIGGFVSMAGEADTEDLEEFKDVSEDRRLTSKKTYQKIIIFLAGIFMNFVLGLLILFCLNITVGSVPVNNAQIGNIEKNSPAYIYGLKAGDIITNIQNVDNHISYPVSNYSDINLTKSKLKTNKSEINLDITITREGQSQVIRVQSKFNTQANKYILGITQATRKMKFSECIRYTFVQLGKISMTIFVALKALIVSFSSSVKQMSGPVGIYSVTAQVTQSGNIANLFYLMALLSVNIGIFNLLPIPGLDGAQTLIAIIEGIFRRTLPAKVKFGLQLTGIILILGLTIFITFQDIGRLIG